MSVLFHDGHDHSLAFHFQSHYLCMVGPSPSIPPSSSRCCPSYSTNSLHWTRLQRNGPCSSSVFPLPTIIHVCPIRTEPYLCPSVTSPAFVVSITEITSQRPPTKLFHSCFIISGYISASQQTTGQMEEAHTNTQAQLNMPQQDSRPITYHPGAPVAVPGAILDSRNQEGKDEGNSPVTHRGCSPHPRISCQDAQIDSTE